MIKKIKEKIIKGNDIYFFEVISNKIVINNNYKGIIILDNNLDELKQLNIFDHMMIYSCYINENDEELLLFCEENKCLVYVNLREYDYKVIDLREEFLAMGFSPVYLWDSNRLILSTYDGKFYDVDVKEDSNALISNSDVSGKYPLLYELWLQTTKHKIVNIHPNNFQFIFKNDQGIYYLHDLLNNNTCINDYLANMAHEITFEQDTFVFTSEQFISVVKQNVEVARIETNNAYMFLRTRFEKTTVSIRIVVLNGSKSDNCKNLITMYDIK